MLSSPAPMSNEIEEERQEGNSFFFLPDLAMDGSIYSLPSAWGRNCRCQSLSPLPAVPRRLGLAKVMPARHELPRRSDPPGRLHCISSRVMSPSSPSTSGAEVPAGRMLHGHALHHARYPLPCPHRTTLRHASTPAAPTPLPGSRRHSAMEKRVAHTHTQINILLALAGTACLTTRTRASCQLLVKDDGRRDLDIWTEKREATHK
jgi:hypothetical protein